MHAREALARRESARKACVRAVEAVDECRRQLDIVRTFGRPEDVQAAQRELDEAIAARRRAWLRWHQVCDETREAVEAGLWTGAI